MYEIIPVGSVPGGDGFLLVTPEKAALIDGSFAFTAPQMIETIRGILKDRPLDYVLLTHTHYDHASCSAYCRDAWESCKVVGSAYGQRVFTRPSAIATMRTLNREAAASFGVFDYPDLLDKLAVDLVVGDGSVIDMGSLTLEIIETPGHTRDTICYYSKEEQLMIAGETLGILSSDPPVVPCYLVGYQMTLDSIKKAAKFAPKHMLMPHYGGILHGKQCDCFFEDALFWAVEMKNRVLAGYAAGKDLNGLILDAKQWIYVGVYAENQPEPAFDLNAGITVRMLLRECAGVDLPA